MIFLTWNKLQFYCLICKLMVAAFNSDKAVIKKTFQTGKSFLGEFEMLLWIIVRPRWTLWIHSEIMLMADGWMF